MTGTLFDDVNESTAIGPLKCCLQKGTLFDLLSYFKHCESYFYDYMNVGISFDAASVPFVGRFVDGVIYFVDF